MPKLEILSLDLVERPVFQKDDAPPNVEAWSKWEDYLRAGDGTDSALFGTTAAGPAQSTRLIWWLVAGAIEALIVGLLVAQSLTEEPSLQEPQVVRSFLTSPTPRPVAPALPKSVSPAPVSAVTARAPARSVPTPAPGPGAKAPMPPASLVGTGFPASELHRFPGGTGVVPGGPPVVDAEAVGQSASAAVSGEPRRIGGVVHRPSRVHYVEPVYPSLAARAGLEGLVVLEATIDCEGNVENVRTLRSVPPLDDAAKEAVRQWKYEPTVIDGVAVPILMTVTVNFTLA